MDRHGLRPRDDEQLLRPRDDEQLLRPRDDEVGAMTVGCHCEEQSDAAIHGVRAASSSLLRLRH